MCSLDVVLRLGDLALLVDDERRPDDTLNGLAVHHLFAVSAPRGEHFAVGIGKQRECQLLVVAELGEFGRLVGGDADDIQPGAVEFGQAVPEVARLPRTSRRRSGGVEVDDDPAALVVRQLYGVAVGIGQAECGGCLLYTSPSPRDGLLSRMPSSA